MAAAQTVLPVLGVPVESQALKGMDSLLSIVQMPAGVPVGTLAIGKAGAANAALLAVAILANSRPQLREKLKQYRQSQTDRVMTEQLPGQNFQQILPGSAIGVLSGSQLGRMFAIAARHGLSRPYPIS
jgi:5-(carboxyamino)imidazole ribonucleotide mutase